MVRSMMWQRFQNCLKSKQHTIEVVLDRIVIKERHPLAALWFGEAALRIARMVMSWLIPWMARSYSFGTLCLSSLALPFWIRGPASFLSMRPFGSCPDDDGLGIKLEVELGFGGARWSLNLREGALAPWNRSLLSTDVGAGYDPFGVDMDRPFSRSFSRRKGLGHSGFGWEGIPLPLGVWWSSGYRNSF